MSDSNNSSSKTFFKILLTIDGSEQSMQAADYAIDIAINQNYVLFSCYHKIRNFEII